MESATDGLFTIQDKNDKFQVNFKKSSCTCGYFNCRHLRMVTDVESHKGIQFKYLLLSAYHKEIRRSDLAKAIHYGEILTKIHGPKFVSNYVRKIIFEETRHVGLLGKLGSNWKTDTALITTAVKKWELPDRPNHLIKKAECIAWSKKNLPLPEDYSTIWKKGSYYEALREYLKVRLYPEKGKRERFHIFEELLKIDPQNPVAADFIRRKKTDKKTKNEISFYEVMAALEHHYGFTQEKNSQYHSWEGTDLAGIDISLPEAYSYDLHTRPGKAAMYKHWAAIRPGEPLPGGLDLRWTGSVLGVLWREKAYTQFGDGYRDVKWEDVAITAEEWRLAKGFDSVFYKDMYNELEPSAVLN